jgi:hypothetical protein
MRARIYQLAKSAMQSGTSGSDEWILDREPAARLTADPLMGWAGGGDTANQVKLRFPSREAALAYAERHAIAADVEIPPTRQAMRPKVYADNFKFGRLENWSH